MPSAAAERWPGLHGAAPPDLAPLAGRLLPSDSPIPLGNVSRSFDYSDGVTRKLEVGRLQSAVAMSRLTILESAVGASGPTTGASFSILKGVRLVAGLVLAAFVVVAGFSIGLFYAPSAFIMLMAGFV